MIPYPGKVILRLLLATSTILILTSTPVQGAVPYQALLRIDLQNPGQLEHFAGVPVYAHLFSQSGPGEARPGEARPGYLLLPGGPAQQRATSSLGLQVKVLDSENRSGGYYLLYARRAADLEQVGRYARVLEREGPTALVKASFTQAESLSAMGLEIVRLQLHPLVLPDRRPPEQPEAITPDPAIQAMIDQVPASTVYSYDAGLSGEFPVMIGGLPYTIQTRHSSQAIPTEKATQYTYEHFQSLGLPVSYHTYTHPSYGSRRNVVAEQSGASQPERIFLITAHLDSTSQTPSTYAPGADDNASGSTGVLVAADILSQYEFDCTLRYVLFTGEEQGLYGSHYYAQQAYNSGENLEAVLNLDMIGYNSDAFPILDLHSRSAIPASTAISNLFADVVSAYNIPLTPHILVDNSLGNYSDNASFWDFGYPAILGIEDDDDFTPYYHTTNDRVGTLNTTYFTDFIKAAVGTMAHMGCLLDTGYLAGTVTDGGTASPITGAIVTAQRDVAQPHSAHSGTDGRYALQLATGTYTVTAQANGFQPYITGSIDITKDMTTTLDIQLEPCRIQGADFSYAPVEPLSGMPVVFTGTVGITSTLPVSYSWDFGDGHTASGQVVSHTYTVSDTYTVDLSAQNCAGVAAASQPVTVTSASELSVSLESLYEQALFGQIITRTMEIGNSGATSLSWSLAEQPQVPWLDESPPSGQLNPQDRADILLTLQTPFLHGTYTTTLLLQADNTGLPPIAIPVTLVADSPHTIYLPSMLAATP